MRERPPRQRFGPTSSTPASCAPRCARKPSLARTLHTCRIRTRSRRALSSLPSPIVAGTVRSCAAIDRKSTRSRLHIRILAAPEYEPDRYAAQIKSLAQGIDQVTLIACGKVLELVAEERESRRPRLWLRHIAYLAAVPARERRRVHLDNVAQEPIKLRCGKMPIPLLMGVEDRAHGFVEPLSGRRGDRGYRDPLDLVQRRLDALANIAQHARPIIDQVPFVDDDDEGAALLHHEARKPEILAVKRIGAIGDQHHHLREADGSQGFRGRKLLERVRHLGAPAQARGVDKANFPIAIPRLDRYRITRHAGLGPRQQALLPEEAVRERRFPDIRPTENGDVKRPLSHVLSR